MSGIAIGFLPKWSRGLMTISTQSPTRQWRRFRLSARMIGVENGDRFMDKKTEYTILVML